MKIITVALLILLFGSGYSSKEKWKQLVPLHSSRQDVERLLGSPVEACKELCEYKTKKAVVSVRFSGHPCDGSERNRWRIPSDTVVDLYVRYKEPPKLVDLNLDLTIFTKTEDPELAGHSYYDSSEKGLTYSVSADGRVYRIHSFANTKDDNALECPSATTSKSPKAEPQK